MDKKKTAAIFGLTQGEREVVGANKGAEKSLYQMENYEYFMWSGLLPKDSGTRLELMSQLSARRQFLLDKSAAMKRELDDLEDFWAAFKPEHTKFEDFGDKQIDEK